MRAAYRLFVAHVLILIFAGVAPAAESFLVGACTHFSQGKGIVESNLHSIGLAGIDSIRDEVSWGAIEREKGRLVMPERFDTYVRRAADQNLQVLLILDYSNRFYDDGDRPRSPEAIEGFCRYAEFVAGHFGDDVLLYEVWNEWDIGIGLPEPYRKGGSPEDYMKLLKAVYPRIKAVQPKAVVMAGASTSGGVKKGWLEDILKLGALDHCGAISIHGYNYNAPWPQRGPEWNAAWTSDVQAMIRGYNDGKDVPFYVTEMGWPTHVTKGGTDPELSASYLARLYLLARTAPAFEGLWWYDFQDDGWDPKHNEHNFGLVRPDLTPKPSHYVIADIAELVASGEYRNRLRTEDEDLWVLRYRLDGEDRWAVWSADDTDRQVVLETTAPDKTLTIRQVGHDAYALPWGFRAWAERRGSFVANRLSLVVGHRPFVLAGDLAKVSIAEIIRRPRTLEGGAD